MKKTLTPAVVAALMLAAAPARAQLSGSLVLGSTGLMAGTQPPPGAFGPPVPGAGGAPVQMRPAVPSHSVQNR